MKLVATLLIALSLALGLVAASSAYLVSLERSDADLLGLTVNELVQVREGEGLGRRAAAVKGDRLESARLAELRAGGVERVRVEEFAFGRWEERWLFLVALLGLSMGAFLARRAASAAVAAEALESEGKGDSPAARLAAIEGLVEELLAGWESRVVRGRESSFVLERLALAIEEHGPAFVGARDRLVARMGLGGYAELMDRFAGAERQLHRAWSSAADGYLEETHACLGRARIVLEEARAALGAAGARDAPVVLREP